ncbi:MAG: hypothetical protein EXR57_00680 [Dehalococcoidia bacterium]|nr:hypothetical protein [Dehalococcoidia bacterium]
MTVLTDAWFAPRSLTCYEVKARPMTTWTFIELRDDAGLAGLAEITYGQGQDRVISMLGRLAGRLRGERLRSDSDVMSRLGLSPADVAKDIVLATAVSGIRSALADALARRAALPLSDFLSLGEARSTPAGAGGLLAAPAHPAPPSAAPRVELYANINRSLLPEFPEKILMPPEPSDRSARGFAAMAKRAMDAGFKTIKCAPFDECRAPFRAAGVPREAEKGLERVQAAKAAIGPERKLYVDCHSRFDLASALALEPELRAAGAAWYEEPLDPLADPDNMRRVHEKAHLPIAGGEHGFGLDTFARLLGDGVVDIVMPDVKHCGGAAEAYRTGVEMERNRAMELSTGSGWLRIASGCVSMHCPSGPVSLLTSAHVTHAFSQAMNWGGGGPLPLEHAVYEVAWRRDVLGPAERIEGGSLVLPGGPGLGASLDYSAVLAHGRRWEP